MEPSASRQNWLSSQFRIGCSRDFMGSRPRITPCSCWRKFSCPNASWIASWRRMMLPNMATIHRQLNSGILGVLPQFDWEALERHARIQEARRPRTPIGFAARDAHTTFYLNQPWIVDRFLRDRLSIE